MIYIYLQTEVKEPNFAEGFVVRCIKEHNLCDNKIIKVGELFYCLNSSKGVLEYYQPYHLYLVDENSKVDTGDWFIELALDGRRESYTKTPYFCDIGNNGNMILTKEINFPFPQNCAKIIKTTNPKLNLPLLTEREIRKIIKNKIK